MAAIKYFCVSDLHAGALASLVTPVDGNLDYDPAGRSNATDQYGRFFARFMFVHNRLHGGSMNDQVPGNKPTAIFLGDILDLAFSGPERACNTFTQALRPFMGWGPFDIQDDKSRKGMRYGSHAPIVIPGNHDHALWTATRHNYQTTIDYKKQAGRHKYQIGRFPPLAEKTNLAKPHYSAGLINSMLEYSEIGNKSHLYYPNFALRSDDGRKAVVFHHGHFLERPYRAMSTLFDVLNGQPRKNISVGELASENAAWIDFAWSTFGDALGVGKDVVSLYQYLLTGGEADKLRERAIRFLGDKVAPSLPMGGTRQAQTLLHDAMAAMVDATIGAYSDSARFSMTEYLPHSTIEDMRWYIGGPLRRQMEEEFHTLPEDLTFVFGHTHKPFVDELVVDGFDNPVSICNTGGWILDMPRLDGLEGASLALIDENHDVVSIRLFDTRDVFPGNAPDAKGSLKPHAQLVTQRSSTGQAFLNDVNKCLAEQAVSASLGTLREVASHQYHARQKMMLQGLEAEDRSADHRGAVL